MADLGSKKISSNYQKLLQISGSGLVADGSGSAHTLHFSGSEYYTSASANDMLLGIAVSGSIVPEGTGWDLGSPTSYFRHLFVSNNSINFVDGDEKASSVDRQLRLTKEDIYRWQTGDFSQTRDATTKTRLSSPRSSTIRTTGVEPFVWDENDDLVSNNLTSLHIVSDRFWSWNSSLSELETKSQKFRYGIVGNTPLNELVIGG